jgi:glycolate oxidase iron-sulfur subunit
MTTAQLDPLLRRCVQCGLCLPHCATYLASGDETLSPRGRLVLLGEVVAERLPAHDPAVTRSFSLCLGCMACTAVCPSGVSFDLIDHLRDLGTRATRAPLRRTTALLDRPFALRALRRTATFLRLVLRRFAGDHWRARLAVAPRPLAGLVRLLGVMPTAPASDDELDALLDGLLHRVGATVPQRNVAAPPALRLAWFDGCADAALLPAASDRLRRLLTALGCTIHTPAGQACCGALAAHDARPRRQAQLQRRNEVAFADTLTKCDHVVVAAAGCGRHLSQYPEPLASKVVDVNILLDRLLAPRLAPVPLRVAVHDPCHRRHGLGMVAEPRRLLRRIAGLEVLEPAEATVCCGSAGAYTIHHGDLAAQMGRRKAEVLVATGCDLIVTSNPGCLGQISDALAVAGSTVPVLTLSDLLWYAWRRTPDPY